MLPLIPLLIIGKLAIAVPARTGALYETDLQEYLRVVGFSPEQHRVDSTAGLLAAFHTVLVLLQASISNFDLTDTNNRKYMAVASFAPDFVKKDGQGKIIGGELKKSETIIEDIAGIAAYKDIVDSFDKDYPLNLWRCFNELQSLPETFQVEDCLSQCLKSVAVPRPDCIKAALSLCQSILLSANLNEARGWLKSGQPHPINQTAKWLKQHIGVDNNLGNQLDSVTDAETKVSLRQVRAMLFESNLFHGEMIDRLDWTDTDDQGNTIDQKNDIKEAVGKITAALSNEQKKQWENLQDALFGALSWHIVNQARYAASQLVYLFKIAGP